MIGKVLSFSVPPSFFFEVSTTRGLVEKALFIEEDLEEGIGIDVIIIKHKERFLALTEIEFEEYMSGLKVDFHRAIFFLKEIFEGKYNFLSKMAMWSR